MTSNICGTELAEVTTNKRIVWDQNTVRSFYQFMAREKLSKHIRPSPDAIDELWTMNNWTRTPADKVQLVVCKILRWLENHIPDFVREEQLPEDPNLYVCYWPQQATEWTADTWDGQTQRVLAANESDSIENRSKEEYLSLTKATTACSARITGQRDLEPLLHNDVVMSDVEEVSEYEKQAQLDEERPSQERVEHWVSGQRQHSSMASDQGRNASSSAPHSTSRHLHQPKPHSGNPRSGIQTTLSRPSVRPSTYIAQNRSLMTLDPHALDQLTINDIEPTIAERLQYPHKGRSLTRACFRDEPPQLYTATYSSMAQEQLPESSASKQREKVRHPSGSVIGPVQEKYQSPRHSHPPVLSSARPDTATSQKSVPSGQALNLPPTRHDPDPYRYSHRDQRSQRIFPYVQHAPEIASPTVSDDISTAGSRLSGSQTPRQNNRQYPNSRDDHQVSTSEPLHTSVSQCSVHRTESQPRTPAGDGLPPQSVGRYSVPGAASNHHLGQQEASGPHVRALKRARHLSSRQDVDDRMAAIALVLGSVLAVEREAEAEYSREDEYESRDCDLESERYAQEDIRSITQEEQFERR